MARQKGIIKIEGTLGDVTFFKTADGHLVRQKGSLNALRIKNDPAFQRTRENGSEFGRAGKAGGLLRQAIRPLLQLSQDRLLTSRLVAAMIKVIQADATSVRGLRNVIDGEAELLQGFDFNEKAKFGGTFFAPYTATADRASGELCLSVPPFVPGQAIAAPAGTTHFKIVSAGSAVDFSVAVFSTGTTETAYLPWNYEATAAVELSNRIAPNSAVPLFLFMGIQFYQDVNGQKYPLKSGTFNTLTIVKVEGV